VQGCNTVHTFIYVPLTFQRYIFLGKLLLLGRSNASRSLDENPEKVETTWEPWHRG